MEALRLEREDWAFDGALWGLLMKLGLPMALQNTIIAVGGMIIQTIVNGFSVAFIAGYTATNKLYGVLEIAATSYGYAMTTYAGQNLGAGKLERISQGMRAGLAIALATSAAIAAVMLGGGQWVLSWFIPAGTTQSGEALEVAVRYLSLMSVCLPVLYVLHLTRSCIQGLGNTLLPMVSGISEFVMRTGGALLLPVGAMGQYGALVLVFCVGQAMACTFSIFAVSAIQQRTPEHMTGKVMACVSTISMCAPPLGQMLYGLWFDASPGWVVLSASGAAIFALGVCSRKLFEKW